MDWSKVDAGLAGALADEPSGRYVVFVHLGPGVDARALAELGIDAAGGGRVRTATVAADDVDRLTGQAWVTHVRLSRPLGLADPT